MSNKDDLKIDWQFDVKLGQWIVAITIGDEGEHFFVVNAGKSNPSHEPGYLEYLKDKARQMFREKGVL